MPHIRLAGLFFAVSLTVVAIGCTRSEEPAAPVQEAQAVDPIEAEIEAELAKLPESDRMAAIAQRICPVSGERLGSMPGVTKVTVEGREVFVCCEGCESDLQADPEKHFAKLDGEAATEGEPAAD